MRMQVDVELQNGYVLVEHEPIDGFSASAGSEHVISVVEVKDSLNKRFCYGIDEIGTVSGTIKARLKDDLIREAKIQLIGRGHVG